MKQFKSQYPISERCPRCGGKEHIKQEPGTYIAFVSDRICTGCETRYTPPTPAWAGMLFILLGTLFVAWDVWIIVSTFIWPARGVSDFIGFFISGWGGAAFATFGIVCIVYGVRSLKRAWKKSVNEPILSDSQNPFDAQ